MRLPQGLSDWKELGADLLPGGTCLKKFDRQKKVPVGRVGELRSWRILCKRNLVLITLLM